MENIYFNCVLMKKIVVQSKYLNENIDTYITTYLKSKLENHCVHEGYIKEGSIKILKRSVGMLIGSRFTGDITYEVVYTADVCNPMEGNIIDCNVKFVNKLGLLGNNGPITIIVGKQFHANDSELNKIKENDIVKVEIIAKKFSLNDKEIKIIAKLWNNKADNKKVIKKDIVSSDLTPIMSDNNFVDLDNEDNIAEFSDEESESEYSIDDNQHDEDDDSIEEDEVELKVENPDENNLESENIELDESEDEDEDDVDEESANHEY